MVRLRNSLANATKRDTKQKRQSKPRLRRRKEDEDILADYILAFGRKTNISDTVRASIARSWAEGTKKGHRSGMRSYLRWCKMHEIPQEMCFPAQEEIVCEYAASWMGEKGSASLPSKINSIRAFHIANGEEWTTWQSLKQVMEGVKKERPRERKQIRPPVTLQRLEVLLKGLDVTDGKDNCVASLA
ncbi:hypothetical protein CPB85DRAFT_1217726, partial [Mucidula mucida]